MQSTFDTYNPTKEDLIANAPEGATHYQPPSNSSDVGIFWKVSSEGKALEVWCLDGKGESTGYHFYYEDSNDSLELDRCIQIPEQGVFEENPTAVRERILKIRKEREAGINEEQDLINKLASMGFKLIQEINEKLEEAKEQHDLQDWRNWEVGDILTLVGSKGLVTDPSFTVGKSYQIHHFEEHGPDHTDVVVIDDSGEQNGYLVGSGMFKFHSRPTK